MCVLARGRERLGRKKAFVLGLHGGLGRRGDAIGSRPDHHRAASARNLRVERVGAVLRKGLGRHEAVSGRTERRVHPLGAVVVLAGPGDHCVAVALEGDIEAGTRSGSDPRAGSAHRTGRPRPAKAASTQVGFEGSCTSESTVHTAIALLNRSVAIWGWNAPAGAGAETAAGSLKLPVRGRKANCTTGNCGSSLRVHTAKVLPCSSTATVGSNESSPGSASDCGSPKLPSLRRKAPCTRSGPPSVCVQTTAALSSTATRGSNASCPPAKAPAGPRRRRPSPEGGFDA